MPCIAMCVWCEQAMRTHHAYPTPPTIRPTHHNLQVFAAGGHLQVARLVRRGISGAHLCHKCTKVAIHQLTTATRVFQQHRHSDQRLTEAPVDAPRQGHSHKGTKSALEQSATLACNNRPKWRTHELKHAPHTHKNRFLFVWRELVTYTTTTDSRLQEHRTMEYTATGSLLQGRKPSQLSI
jgi:hypothetical protein